MNENDRYIPPSQGGSGLGSPSDERPPQLGKISLLTIILSFLLGGLVKQILKEQSPSPWLDMAMAAGVLISVVLAIVALATRRGRPGVMAPAIATLVMGGLVIWLGATNFMKARERALQARAQGKYRLSEEQLKAIEAEVSSPRESSQGTSRPSPEAAPQAPAAAGPRTIQNEINQALVPYTREQMSAWSKCVQANRELRAAGEFTPAAFTTKENIEKRRAILVRIVEATQEWENLQVTAEQKVTAALNRPSIPPEAARRHLAEWRKDREREIPVLMQLRTAERNGSRALIGLLSILEHDLGRWELSPDKKSAVFQRPGAAEEYRELLDEARASRQEQNQLSAQFAALLKSKEAPVPGAPNLPFSASAGRAPAATAASASAPAAPAPTGRDQWVANIAKATGAEGELFRVAKPYLDRIDEQNEACVAASKALHAAGGLNPRELTTKAAIVERRTLVQRVITTAEQWEAAAFNADQSLPAAVQQPGIPPDKAQVFLSRWRDAKYQPLLLIKRERASERLAARSMLGILALLERELGNWEASPDGKQLKFKNPGCSDELRKLMQEFNTQNTARQEASRQVQAFSPAK